MDERLKIIKEKYVELERELATPEVLSDFQRLKEQIGRASCRERV